MRALLRLAWLSLANRRFTALLTIATIAISVMLLLGVERLRQEAREGFLRTVSGTDLIVGARANPVQLLLYSVFRLGDATNNVSWQSYRMVADDPRVAWTIPLSLGDSHRGYRVLGTSGAYFEHLRYAGGRGLSFAAGAPFEGLYDAVIGAEVARALRYSVGDRIVVAHGTGRATLAEHDDQPFTVVGILERTGTPVDQTVHVSLEALEAIHKNWRFGTRIGEAPTAEQLAAADLTPRSITAFYVGVERKLATFAVQRMVNEYRAEPLSAILPGVALQQLWNLLGGVERALLATAACVVLAGLLGMLTAVLATLNERRREMAILRSVGARPSHVLWLLLLESAFLTVLGVLAGMLLLQAGLLVAAPLLESRFGVFLSVGWPSAPEWRLLGLVLGAGFAVGLVPAFLAYRRSVADGMTVRT
ncbi:MAG: ABC transporter permease [Xanthomonadaceae bacterium]|jgi:putative ABC transport system permease protein|nr:ABC transporter permease [Xanthomonadaceae bacterium]